MLLVLVSRKHKFRDSFGSPFFIFHRMKKVVYF
ncbi:hypothetical protein [Klebsiella phage vB_KpnM_TU02]|nr:hypothetical protein [Klebsiella phage vB_KpnM_TU02]